MKVLHYVPNFSVTTETFIYDQIVGVNNNNCTSAVLTAKRLNSQSRPFERVYLSPLKKLFLDRVTAICAFRFQLLPWFIDYSAWEQAITDFQPDIIHCHAGNALKTWMHVSQKLNLTIPTLVSMHGSDVNSEPLLRKKYQQVLSQAGTQSHIHWTVPSEFLKTKAQQNLYLPREKVSVVYNGVNQNFLAVTPQLSFEKPKLICVGRFIYCKGHEVLIRAFQKVVSHHPSAELTLIGNGPLKQQLIQVAEELKVIDNINFVDSVNHDALPNMLIKHNLYIQPSVKDPVSQQEESFGVAALEALVAGLPAVVSDCGGLTEIAKQAAPEEANVVQQFDHKALAEAILSMFAAQASVSEETRKQLASTFSSEKNINDIKELYSDLLSE